MTTSLSKLAYAKANQHMSNEERMLGASCNVTLLLWQMPLVEMPGAKLGCFQMEKWVYIKHWVKSTMEQ